MKVTDLLFNFNVGWGGGGGGGEGGGGGGGGRGGEEEEEEGRGRVILNRFWKWKRTMALFFPAAVHHNLT